MSENSYRIPVSKEDLNRSSQSTSRFLIDAPSALPNFFGEFGNVTLIAQESNNRSYSDLLERFIDKVTQQIRRYEWERKQHDKLSLEDARALLQVIPNVSMIGRKRRTYQNDLIQSIARGYYTDRFERSYDWRRALELQELLLEAALSPNPNLDLVSTWFDLQTNQYPEISVPNTTAWRAIFIGVRSAAQRDEKHAAIAYGLDRSVIAISEIFNRRDEVRKNSLRYLPLDVQQMVIQAVILDGFDPRSGQGKKRYDNYLLVYKDLIRNPHKIKIDDPTTNEIINKTKVEDISKASSLPITPDMIESSINTIQNPERYALLAEVMNEGFQMIQHTDLFISRKQSHLTVDGKYIFPANVCFGRNSQSQRLIGLIDRSRKREMLVNHIQTQLKEKGPNYSHYPFNIRGFQGYLIMPNDKLPSPHEVIKLVDKVLQEYKIETDEQLSKIFRKVPEISVGFVSGNIQFFIVDPEFMSNSTLESFFYWKIPSQLLEKEHLDAIFNKILEMTRSLPARFTRIPTRVGDSYQLIDHPDLPGVFRRARIQKSFGGGINYQLTLPEEPMIFADQSPADISGSVDFRAQFVNISFPNSVNALPVSQRWIIRSTLLHLIERSCCPELREVEEEREQYENRGFSIRSVPGYIGHVGGFRSDGSRKRFTDLAESNFAEAVSELFGELGLSLSVINRRHHETPKLVSLHLYF